MLEMVTLEMPVQKDPLTAPLIQLQYHRSQICDFEKSSVNLHGSRYSHCHGFLHSRLVPRRLEKGFFLTAWKGCPRLPPAQARPWIVASGKR